jgi:formate--tetrahydrofolate ligase
MDLNDRQLRVVNTGLSGEKSIVPREDGFDITVASEIMAVLCLSENIHDLKEKISNIIIGYNTDKQPIMVKDLNAQGALTVLLKDAIKPNLVQTIENNPVLIHGGPFANIAHGCNSIIATKLALKLGDYVVTEAGFGADLGAEKFLDIKCRKANLKPDAVVCVATIKALKYHGGMPKEEIQNENIDALVRGSKNILKHIENLKEKYGLNVVVAINKYTSDTDKEIQTLTDILKEHNVELSLCENWEKGGAGITDLAEKVVNLCERPYNFNFIYDVNDTIENKIEKVCTNIYGASGVEYSDKAKQNIELINKFGYGNLPVCIAKTQYSLSDDPKNLECLEPFNIHVEDVILRTGAGFVVVLTGKIMTMPGLPRVPAAENIDIDETGKIVGIF